MQRKVTPDARQDILGIYAYTARGWGENQSQAPFIIGADISLRYTNMQTNDTQLIRFPFAPLHKCQSPVEIAVALEL